MWFIGVLKFFVFSYRNIIVPWKRVVFFPHMLQDQWNIEIIYTITILGRTRNVIALDWSIYTSAYHLNWVINYSGYKPNFTSDSNLRHYKCGSKPNYTCDHTFGLSWCDSSRFFVPNIILIPFSFLREIEDPPAIKENICVYVYGVGSGGQESACHRPIYLSVRAIYTL